MTLPLYPQLKMTLEKWLLQIMDRAARQELGPFGESPRFIQHEGTTHRYNTTDGQERRTDYHEGMVEFRLGRSDIASMEVDGILELVIEKGRELGVQQAQYHYQVLNSVTEETGNVVDTQGQPITLDLLFETFEKLHVSFDDHGIPRMPTIVIRPEMAPRFQQLIQEASADEAIKGRMIEIIERKRKEWNEEQNRRKLVD